MDILYLCCRVHALNVERTEIMFLDHCQDCRDGNNENGGSMKVSVLFESHY